MKNLAEFEKKYEKEILTIARRMAESGDIVLGGKGGEEMI